MSFKWGITSVCKIYILFITCKICILGGKKITPKNFVCLKTRGTFKFFECVKKELVYKFCKWKGGSMLNERLGGKIKY